MALIGYARVSKDEQNLDLQLDALRAAGVTRIYSDHGVSGSRTSRPELDRCLDRLERGDILVVYTLSRFGRSGSKTVVMIDELKDRGVGFRSITEGLDTAGPMGECMMAIVAAFAKLERDLLIERTHAGLEAARARGHVGGRPAKIGSVEVEKALELRAKGVSHNDVARILNVSRATLYRHLAQV